MALDDYGKQQHLDAMPKRKEPPLPPKEQFKRFVEAVREREADETGKEFERAFKKVAHPPKSKTRKAE